MHFSLGRDKGSYRLAWLCPFFGCELRIANQAKYFTALNAKLEKFLSAAFFARQAKISSDLGSHANFASELRTANYASLNEPLYMVYWILHWIVVLAHLGLILTQLYRFYIKIMFSSPVLGSREYKEQVMIQLHELVHLRWKISKFYNCPL